MYEFIGSTNALTNSRDSDHITDSHLPTINLTVVDMVNLAKIGSSDFGTKYELLTAEEKKLVDNGLAVRNARVLDRSPERKPCE